MATLLLGLLKKVNLLHVVQQSDDDEAGLLGSQLFHEVHDSWGSLPRGTSWSETPRSIGAFGLANHSHLD